MLISACVNTNNFSNFYTYRINCQNILIEYTIIHVEMRKTNMRLLNN